MLPECHASVAVHRLQDSVVRSFGIIAMLHAPALTPSGTGSIAEEVMQCDGLQNGNLAKGWNGLVTRLMPWFAVATAQFPCSTSKQSMDCVFGESLLCYVLLVPANPSTWHGMATADRTCTCDAAAHF
jgi:hypothetical protein